jgi:eukaryotic-like serine/threonine-protein kinase
LGKSESLWSVLRFQDDPSLQTYAIHEIAARNFNPAVLVERLVAETDASIRQALLLSLGEYQSASFDQDLRNRLMETAGHHYLNDGDAGVHSAAGWLLERMGERDLVQKFDRQLI